jgi:hypothetical protein
MRLKAAFSLSASPNGAQLSDSLVMSGRSLKKKLHKRAKEAERRKLVKAIEQTGHHKREDGHRVDLARSL